MKRNTAGFSLIELMVALVICGLMVTGVYAFLIGQHRVFTIQTEVVGMQQDARASLMLMVRDLRMAGFSVGTSGFDVEGATQAISVVETAGQPDQITVVYAAEEVSPVQDITGNQVTLVDSADSFDTDKRKYIAFETERAVYTINDISEQTLTLDSAPPSCLEDFGAKAFLVKAITYQIDTARRTLERVDSTQDPPGAGVDPDDVWDDVATYVADLQAEYPYNGDNRLLKLTLKSSFQDCNGETRTRGHEAILKIRNIGT